MVRGPCQECTPLQASSFTKITPTTCIISAQRFDLRWKSRKLITLYNRMLHNTIRTK